MRSDRLKQVMLELDGRFSEGNFGFSKFSKFVAEAANRGLLRLHKLENGQYEVKPGSGGGSAGDSAATKEPKARSRPSARRGRPARGRPGQRLGDGEAKAVGRVEARDEAEGSGPEGGLDPEPLRSAYDLMLRCLQKLKEMGKDSARDSDVKRKMLEADRGFDEGELGFGKFSRFLLQAEEHGVISLQKTEMGNYRVSLADSAAVGSPSPATGGDPSPRGGVSTGRLGPRGGSGGRKQADGPVLLEGQTVGKVSGTPDRSSPGAGIDVGSLGLPTSERAIVSYLTNSYGGVGKKTAEALVEAFGPDIFGVFEREPARVADIVPRRALQVLAEWKADFARRSAKPQNEKEVVSEPVSEAAPAPERESGVVNSGSGAERVPPPSSFPSSTPVPDSSPSATPAPRSGGALRRTRRNPGRSPSSGSDE
jgi:hypothetical protein